MISYSGVPLHAPGNAEIAWARTNIDPAKIWEFLPSTWPGKNLSGLPFRSWIQRPIEIGVLSWPTGASRFGVYHGIVDSVQLAKIPRSSSSQPLVIADGLHTVTVPMYLLPPRPLQAIPGSVSMWLITLVDVRYTWWFKAASIESFSSWAGLFSAVAGGLGATITVDAVPGVYLNPPKQLEMLYESLPILLDAAAASVGLRIVANYDGTFKAQNPANGSAQAALNLLPSNQQAVAPPGPWPLRAGGQIAVSDLRLAIPESVTVAFGGKQDYTANPVLYAAIVPTTPTGMLPTSKPIHSTAEANYAGGVGTPTNQGELEALATQITADWSAWQTANWDLVYWGPCPWIPESQTDLIEFTHRDGDISTRVQRGPWNNWPDVLYHQSSNTEGNDTLAGFEGATLVPVGGYYGATGSSGDGTIGTMSDSSASGAWAVKDGVVLHLGSLNLHDSSTGFSPGTSSITFTNAGNVTPSVTSDSLGHATVTLNASTTTASDSAQINSTTPIYQFNRFNLVAGPGITLTMAADTPGAGVQRVSDTITLGGMGGNPTIPVTIYNPLEICGYQFWCCETVSFTTSSVTDWSIPYAATVYPVSLPTTATSLQSIIPSIIGGVAGPQIIALTNDSTLGLTIPNNGSASTGKPIFLPPAYGSSVTLLQHDSIILWYDACDGDGWRVLSCTVATSSSGSSVTAARAGLTGTSIPNATITNCTFPVTASWIYNTGNMAFTGGCTIPTSGVYHFGCYVTFPPAVANTSIVVMLASSNGGFTISEAGGTYVPANAPAGTIFSCSGDLTCSTNDTITVSVYQANALATPVSVNADLWGHKVN